jgi:RimJ/RimL family protein N-acetyltransferase
MRIALEPLTRGHAPEMFTVLADPSIYRYIDEAAPVSLEALTTRYARLEQGKSADGSELWLNWIVREVQTGNAIGFVQATVSGRQAWIAYVIAPSSQGKGFGREATEEMMRILRERHGTTRFLANVDSRNDASIHLARSLGFIHVPGADVGDQRYEKKVADPI